MPARRPAAASVTLTFGMIRLIIMGPIVAGGWMSRLPASIDYARRGIRAYDTGQARRAIALPAKSGHAG